MLQFSITQHLKVKGRRRIDNCSNFWWRTERRRGRVEGGGEEGKKYGERVTEKRGGKKETGEGMERREEAGGVGGGAGTGGGGERRERGRKAEEQGSSPSCRPPSPESRDQLAARTAASDPPIARAFITCLGPGSLTSPPPLPTAVPRGPPWAGGRPPSPDSGPNPPDRLRPAATAPPARAAAASPAPSLPPRCGPPGLPGERIPALTSRRRDPAPPRRRERLHSRDALSAPAPPAASPPRGALSSLRPAAPERCRPPQSRPASPLPPQRSRLSNGGRRASPALAWLTESLSPPNFTSAASLPSPLPPARPPPRLSARPPGQLRVRGEAPLPAAAGIPGKPGRARAARRLR